MPGDSPRADGADEAFVNPFVDGEQLVEDLGLLADMADGLSVGDF